MEIKRYSNGNGDTQIFAQNLPTHQASLGGFSFPFSLHFFYEKKKKIECTKKKHAVEIMVIIAIKFKGSTLNTASKTATEKPNWSIKNRYARRKFVYYWIGSCQPLNQNGNFQTKIEYIL